MTLMEFFVLLRRWWKIAVILPLVCAAICAAALLVAPAQYQASAVIAVSAEVSPIGGIAELVASEDTNEETAVSVSSDANKRQLTITASGENAQDCIAAANQAAKLTEAEAASMYGSVAMEINQATAAQDISPSIAKYALVALFAGFFAACCLIVLLDMWRRPVKDANDLAETSQSNVLGAISPAGENQLELAKLAANIGFAAEGKKAVCLIPADDSIDIEAVRDVLSPEMKRQGIPQNITTAPTFSKSETAAYAAREAGAAVIVAKRWTTSQYAVEESARDLTLAEAKVIGSVLIEGHL